MRIRSPNSSGKVFPIQGPTANTNVEAASDSSPPKVTSLSRRPSDLPRAARAIRSSPPSISNRLATDSMARRARTTPALGSWSPRETPSSVRIQGQR